MAQIIKFKRGSLENVESSSASLGELLLTTGSSSVLGAANKSYDIGEGLLFIASGSSTDGNPRAVNRFLAGGVAPDLSGNPVGKSLQGVPFYVTGSNKVVLLNDGADANSHITLDLTNNIDSGSLLPFISGSVFGTVSGDILINDAGVASIQANSVALGTDTTGNYVGTITGGTGIASSGATTGEGIAHTLSVDLTELTLGNGLDAGNATTLNLDLTEVIATDGANRILTSDGDGTLTAESNFTFNGSTLSVTGQVTATGFTGSFTGSFTGDGSGLTGLVTELDFAGDTGTGTVDLLSQTLTVAGGGGIDTSVSNQTVTVAVDSGSMATYFRQNAYSNVSGDILIASNGAATIQANSVALGTDTTGNYVATITAGTGLTSTGATTGENIAHSLSVDYGSSAGTAVQGNTTITINGTANEVQVTGTAAQALGGAPSYTIGLPDDVTITCDLCVNCDLSVGGNLTVSGTVTTINTETVTIEDNIIEINAAGSPASTGGIYVRDATGGSTVSGSLIWDASVDYWKAGTIGSEKRVPVQSADFTTNSFLFASAAGTLTSTAAPTVDGDYIKWNGSAFVVSNVIDGGSF